MKFLLCAPASRKTWDVFGILRREFPHAEVYLWCRGPLEGRLARWFYPGARRVGPGFPSADQDLRTAYALPLEDWFIDLLQSWPLEARPRFAAPEPAALARWRNKADLYAFLSAQGIRAPAIYGRGDLHALPPETQLVLKPPQGDGARGVEFLSAAEGSRLTEDEVACRFFCERIGHSNRIEGVFFLARHGEIQSAYAHRRILTWPPQAGVSVLAETIDSPPLIAFAQKVVAATNYHGFGMIETMEGANGEPCLIEINTRIWGSFLLSQCLETPMLASYVYLCHDIAVPPTGRHRYRRFLFPLRAVLSWRGHLELARSLVDPSYLVSGFYHVPRLRSLLFPLAPCLRHLLRHANQNL